MTRGSDSSRGKSPGRPAKRGGAVVGDADAVVPAAAPAMPKFSIKVAAVIFWLLMAAAATVDQGDKWKYIVTVGVVCACLRCLYDLDEKDPNYNYYVVGLIFIAACAFWAFYMIPYFANYKEFGKKLASTHPVMETMYAIAKENIDEFIKDNPEAGMAPVEHDTYMQLVLAQFKSWEVAQNKLFSLF
jgi:hypothetical protein